MKAGLRRGANKARQRNCRISERKGRAKFWFQYTQRFALAAMPQVFSQHVQQSNVVRMLPTTLKSPDSPRSSRYTCLASSPHLNETLLKQERPQCMARRMHPGPGLSVGQVFADV
jgi:hypothetical protein